MTEPRDVDRSELEAVIETRRELGPSYEPALVDSFADKVEAAIEVRAAAQIAERREVVKAEGERGKRQFILGIISLGAGIPITAISAGIVDLPGLIVAWTGIVAVNVAHAWQSRAAR